MTDHDDDLERLAPRSVTVAAGGETLEVQPLTIGQLPAMSKALKGIDVDIDNLDVIGLIAEHGESVIEAIAIATCEHSDPQAKDKHKQWILKLPMDEFAELVTAVLEVNADFFARRVLPSMKRAVERMMATAGRIASNNSLTAGIAGATSKPTH